jgi:TolB protein
MIYLFFVLISFGSFLFSEELIVSLETVRQLIPISITPFVDENSGLSKENIRLLEKVFRFDFDQNGTTTVTSKPQDYSLYSIEILIKERKLNARIISKENDKKIEGIILTGNANKDRHLIHQVADTIHKALFGENGVASTRFLYVLKKEEKETSEVWEADYDGENAMQLTHNSGYAVTPTYIPPKQGAAPGSFFYVSYQTGQPKIFVASLKEGVGRRFSSIPGNQLMPAISRQRDQVAFIGDASGTTDLFLQKFNPEQGVIGKPRQIFTGKMSAQGSPTFSPDGKNIAFVSDKDGSPRIYIIEIPPTGTALKDIKTTQISRVNAENTAPNWSPDGKKLAYCARTKGIRQIWIYDFAENIEKQLTQGPRNKENPSWGPNSTHLIYNTSDRNECELYLINLNNPLPVKISSGEGEKRFPSWFQ